MRAPLSWLAEYVDLVPGSSGADVLAALVRVGLEEEALHTGDITGAVVVGRVLDAVAEPQRNGKIIRWCQVDTGDGEPRGIVCGAPNVGAGDLVVVSLPGAVLPGGFAIAARRTYGHVSDGMICSAAELGMGEDHDGIIRLADLGLGDAAVGSDAIALLGLGGETIEVAVTPDRGYALSIRGLAREYSHATGSTFRDPAAPVLPDPTLDGIDGGGPVTGMAVSLADGEPLRGQPGCDRFVTRVVRGVRATGPSPQWMQRRLEQCGMRPRGLAVDVTNYVMLALGQPLHAYDLATVVAPLTVRRAAADELLVTLDGVRRTLHPEDLVITDAATAGGGRILGLAGVMGGAVGEVGETTTDVLVEAAHFDPVSVARTIRRHRIASEAGRRFERGVDPDLPATAAAMAVRLLVEFGGGVAGPITDEDERTPTPPIRLPRTLAADVVGVAYSDEEVITSLTAVGCRVEGVEGGDAPVGSDDDLVVRPPSWRPDLRAGIDLVEEVARLRGYDSIESVLATPPPGRGLTRAQRIRRNVGHALAERGYVEVLSYPFVAPETHDRFRLAADDPRRRAVRLANPLSQQQPQLRTSLLPPLLDLLRRNVSRGATDLALFEIGVVVRPEPDAEAAPCPPPGQRPSDAELAAIVAAVPPQPLRAAIVLSGNRDIPGWNTTARAADWSDAVDAVHSIATGLGVQLDISADDHAPWHPGRCARLTVNGLLLGHAGELHPSVLRDLELPPRTVAAEIDLDVLVAAAPLVREASPVSPHSAAKEDIAVVVAADVTAAAVATAIRVGGGDLVESVRLFDVYTGDPIPEAARSLAFTMRLRASDRTLTAAEIAAVRAGALDRAAADCGAVLRG